MKERMAPTAIFRPIPAFIAINIMSQTHAGCFLPTHNEQHCAALNQCPLTDEFHARDASFAVKLVTHHINDSFISITVSPRVSSHVYHKFGYHPCDLRDPRNRFRRL